MKIENRIELLEQRLNDGILTEIEQDELFQLLESAGELDRWLDDNALRLTPNDEVIYEDKELLKSIAQPIEKLEPDMTVTYENKELLYHKGTRSYLSLSVKIAVSIAAVVLLTLSTWRDPAVVPTIEKIETIALLKSNQLASKDSIKIIEKFKPVDFEPVLKNSSSKLYVSELVAELNLPLIDLEIRSTKSIKPSIQSDAPTPTPELRQECIVLFAEAETWVEGAQKHPDEIIINSEEWKPSKKRITARVKNTLNHFKSRILQKATNQPKEYKI